MNDLIDLGGFTVQDKQVINASGASQQVRTTFNHGLIIITEADAKTGKIKLSSNFEWQQMGSKWRPDLSKHNDHFVDVVSAS